ncbi:hypothetical protein UFOVP274_64 [uncultured Caudovirales phage]|uniref:Uncharacterized protein n=1 Tax=uncultured Caudovirales phage TaxID=2100421 RepID=A0A6J5LSV0_9CAUD|nr:hypothetical protein UFOVP274_64 [uncultured Caudovirales phage]
MNALQFEAVKVALKQDRTGYILTLSVHPDEVPEELLRDFVGARYGVAMVRVNDDETATPYDNRVSKAGMLCRTRDFQLWMQESGLADKATEKDAVEGLYKTLKIDSRSQLNGNEEAKNRFDLIVSAYEQWKKEPF